MVERDFYTKQFWRKGFNLLAQSAHIITGWFPENSYPLISLSFGLEMRFVNKVVIALLWYINFDIVQRWKNIAFWLQTQRAITEAVEFRWICV